MIRTELIKILRKIISIFAAPRSLATGLFILLLTSLVMHGCGLNRLQQSYSEQREEMAGTDTANNHQAMGDSLRIPGYYYTFIFSDRNTTPEWILGNLAHFGVEVKDAWYIGSDNPHAGRTISTDSLPADSLLTDSLSTGSISIDSLTRDYSMKGFPVKRSSGKDSVHIHAPYPPAMIIRLDFESPEILRHHCMKCVPPLLSRFDRRWMHYPQTLRK